MAPGASGSPWLVDGAGNPLAPPSVVEALASINERLGIMYHVALRAFIVTLRWPEDDPRRQMIREGVLSPHSDFEALCPVPANVSLDELHGWVEQQLVRVGESRDDIRRMVAENEARVAKQNAALVENAADAAANEFIEAVANPAPKGGRRRTRVA
jgi:hypothetical protein